MSNSERQPRCPICRKTVEMRPENVVYPFCSSHCQMIDLGRWMNEEYRMPTDANSTERSLPPEEDEILN